jgi:hypothetical protein
MSEEINSKQLSIKKEVVELAELILKKGPILREDICKTLKINEVTLTRRLKLLKEDRQYYLYNKRGKALILEPVTPKQSKTKGSTKLSLAQEITQTLYSPEYTDRINPIKRAIELGRWVTLNNYNSLTDNGRGNKIVFPLEIVYTDIEVKLLGVSQNEPNIVKTYLVDRMDTVTIRDGNNKPKLTIDDIRYDDFGMIYTDKIQLKKYTLSMTTYASEMLKHDFRQFKPAIKRIKKNVEERVIDGRTFRYEYIVEINTSFPAPLRRFVAGVLDSVLIRCDKQEGIDYIRDYFKKTIIPCVDTQFVDVI